MKRLLYLMFLAVSLMWVSSASEAAYIKDMDISYYRVLKTDSTEHADAAKIEEIIRYFADAMYEATNGEMKLGIVRIFQGTIQHISDMKSADILWSKQGHPSALAGAGATSAVTTELGGKINMFDTFDYNGATVCNFLENKESMAYGGYALASLTSSYLFNLRSEYPISRANQSFTGLQHESIMKDPSVAVKTGNVEALNYSVKSMYTDGVTTEQSARWDASGWEHLKSHSILTKEPKGKKAPYSLEITANKHSAKAQTALKILWISSPIYVLTIDVSGSMQGERFKKAIASAKDYVKNMTPGTRVGINAFSDEVIAVSPIVQITTENEKDVKAQLIEKLNSLRIIGNTAMYDACQVGIQQIIEQPNADFQGKYILLFTDGLDNVSQISRYDVIKIAQENSVTINSIGIEDGIDVKILQELTAETKGSYVMTSNPIDIQEMLFTQFGHNPGQHIESQVSVHDTTIKANASGRSSFTVEPNATQVRAILLTDKSDVGKSVKVTARSPKGKKISVPYSEDTDKHELILDKPEAGTWTLEIKNNSKSDILTRTSVYVGAENLIVPYVQATNGLNDKTLVYATVNANGTPVTGTKVTGTLVGNNINQKLDFNDMGLGEDVLGSDGIYTAVYDGSLTDGNYRIVVSFDGYSGGVQNKITTAISRYYMLYPGKEFVSGEGEMPVTDNAKAAVGGFQRSGVSVVQVKAGLVNGNFSPVPNDGYINYPRLKDKLDLAERAMKRGDYDLAHSYVEEAKRVWAEDSRIYFMDGRIYDAENEHAEALICYRNAMLLAPYWAENYYRYGQALINLKREEDALYILERMRYMFPDNTWTNKMEAAYKFVEIN